MMDNFHAYIFHGNFCFPCGNLFPWNTAKFLSDFLFPLISTRFSLDTYSSRNAQGFPWYLLVGKAAECSSGVVVKRGSTVVLFCDLSA